MSNPEDAMQIVEKHVSAGDRPIFDLDEFPRARCTPTWPTPRSRGRGSRRSGSTGMAGPSGSSAARHSRRTSCGNPAAHRDRGLGPGVRAEPARRAPRPGGGPPVRHRRRPDDLPEDLGPDEDRWDPRFREDIEGETDVPLIRFTPETVVLRDQRSKPPKGDPAGHGGGRGPGPHPGRPREQWLRPGVLRGGRRQRLAPRHAAHGRPPRLDGRRGPRSAVVPTMLPPSPTPAPSAPPFRTASPTASSPIAT